MGLLPLYKAAITSSVCTSNNMEQGHGKGWKAPAIQIQCPSYRPAQLTIVIERPSDPATDNTPTPASARVYAPRATRDARTRVFREQRTNTNTKARRACVRDA